MIAPPAFSSPATFRAGLSDLALWEPVVTAILDRHGLSGAGREPVAGYNPTNPVFLCGDVVVKLFGQTPRWRLSFTAERAALALLASQPQIAAPRLLGQGRLSDQPDAPWPYLITTRMPGHAWRDAALTAAQRHTVAAELGEQVRRLHALAPDSIATAADWSPPDAATAAARSSLPPHLAAQAAAFVARLGPPDLAVTHGDLVAMHVYVEGGHLAGVIDWGDTVAGDRHLEIIQLYRDLFACDAALLRTFLEASGWPRTADFPRQALGWALRRQAIGLAQHHTIDVFMPVAARFPLEGIATLDELALLLFSGAAPGREEDRLA